MKHYIDIERCRPEDVDVENIHFSGNTMGFQKGDVISITEKIDGANSSITYNTETNSLDCFSHKNQLTFASTLRGFYNYVQKLDIAPFAEHPNWIVFGEWLVRHTIVYREDAYNQWYVFSIYNTETENYEPQETVKQFCNTYGYNYVHELYYGEFISWKHCKSFMNSPYYGDEQEGIVVKNMTNLSQNRHFPHALKIVNERFKEIQKCNRQKKIEDPNKIQEKNHALDVMSMVTTEARVRKILLKCVDEGILPEEIKPQDMGLVARTMPKLVYDDIMKEEPQALIEAGEYGGKICSNLTMQICKKLLGIG